MKNISYGIIAIMACAMIAKAAPKSDLPMGAQMATTAAEKTLNLIDEGSYAESWNASSEFFKKSVSKEQWISAMNQARAPLGKRVSREVLSAKEITNLPGAPKGTYVVIQFQSVFENKKQAIETFTPVLENDGQWRMTGYYIK